MGEAEDFSRNITITLDDLVPQLYSQSFLFAKSCLNVKMTPYWQAVLYWGRNDILNSSV